MGRSLAMTGQYKSTTSGDESTRDHHFVRLHLNELLELLTFVGKKQLEQRDITLLMTLISCMDWRSGRCHTTIDRAIEIIGAPRAQAVASLKRLKQLNIVISVTRVRDGQRSLIINPWLVSMGSSKRQGFNKKTYVEMLAKESATNPLENLSFIGGEDYGSFNEASEEVFDELRDHSENDSCYDSSDFGDLIKRAANMNHST